MAGLPELCALPAVYSGELTVQISDTSLIEFSGAVLPEIPEYPKGSEGYEETELFKHKPWDRLKVEDFDARPYCFAFLGPGGFQYFFGALMWAMMKEEILECRALENFLIMWESSFDVEEGLETTRTFQETVSNRL